jgi:hypothetical protein
MSDRSHLTMPPKDEDLTRAERYLGKWDRVVYKLRRIYTSEQQLTFEEDVKRIAKVYRRTVKIKLPQPKRIGFLVTYYERCRKSWKYGTVTGFTIESDSPPGFHVMHFGSRFLSKTTIERVVMPIVSDMQLDWKVAVDGHHRGRAVFVCCGGYVHLAVAMLKHGAIVVVKTLGIVWSGRSVSPERKNER